MAGACSRREQQRGSPRDGDLPAPGRRGLPHQAAAGQRAAQPVGARVLVAPGATPMSTWWRRARAASGAGACCITAAGLSAQRRPAGGAGGARGWCRKARERLGVGEISSGTWKYLMQPHRRLGRAPLPRRARVLQALVKSVRMRARARRHPRQTSAARGAPACADAQGLAPARRHSTCSSRRPRRWAPRRTRCQS